ncbi:MAG TPA: hypothetical protein VFA18_07340, partial [Gemmataceae bacterium]|nr:hypothetical protein [Gemmataceae bacterium]
MDLAAIVESREHVCCRYRVRAFLPFLEQAGHTLTIYPRPRTTTGWLRLASRLRHTDGIILQRKVLPVWQLRLLRSHGRFLIYDFDDAIIWRHSSDHGAVPSRRRQRLFAAAVRLSDCVVAGNAWLADQARIWRADGLHIIPTCVDPNVYPVARHHRSGAGVELAWIGSSSTLHTLAGAQDMLEMLGERTPELRLKVICDRFPEPDPMPMVACPWSEASETAALASADIGISWLPNDPWYRGKCGLKV